METNNSAWLCRIGSHACKHHIIPEEMSLELSMFVSLVLWLAFAFLEGKQEAFWFHIQDFDRPFPSNPHVAFTIRRAIVLTLCSLLVFSNADSQEVVESVFGIIVSTACNIMVFPMVHDGSYYEFRNFYNGEIYPFGWRSNPVYPKNSVAAKFSLRFSQRTVFFILGLLLFGAFNIFA